jgi:DNA-binding transcriptional MerR regulator
MENTLPSIPAKRYFTIGEVGDLCGVKPHVLRYWEQEFTQLRPMKRRGNRRYYQHHEVLMIRRIRDLLYDQGFTISGARNKMQEILQLERDKKRNGEAMLDGVEVVDLSDSVLPDFDDSQFESQFEGQFEDRRDASSDRISLVRRELYAIREMLTASH